LLRIPALRKNMNFKKFLFSMLAGGSLAVGGGWVYRRQRARREAVRRLNERKRWIIIQSITGLAGISSGRVPVQEAYFFIWVVERVCARHKIDCPEFGFKVKEGLLFSSQLTYILRKMIKEGALDLEGRHLLPGEDGSQPMLSKADREVLKVIRETVAQWKSDFPDEPLVRFGQLFR